MGAVDRARPEICHGGPNPDLEAEIVVVGAGNAAICAALSAHEHGAERILVVERSVEAERGGNSRFTVGAFRISYDGVDDLMRVMPDLNPSDLENTDFGSYPASKFFEDMARVTRYRANPDPVHVLVTRSLESVVWMREQGVQFLPEYVAG